MPAARVKGGRQGSDWAGSPVPRSRPSGGREGGRRHRGAEQLGEGRRGRPPYLLALAEAQSERRDALHAQEAVRVAAAHLEHLAQAAHGAQQSRGGPGPARAARHPGRPQLARAPRRAPLPPQPAPRRRRRHRAPRRPPGSAARSLRPPAAAARVSRAPRLRAGGGEQGRGGAGRGGEGGGTGGSEGMGEGRQTKGTARPPSWGCPRRASSADSVSLGATALASSPGKPREGVEAPAPPPCAASAPKFTAASRPWLS